MIRATTIAAARSPPRAPPQPPPPANANANATAIFAAHGYGANHGDAGRILAIRHPTLPP